LFGIIVSSVLSKKTIEFLIFLDLAKLLLKSNLQNLILTKAQFIIILNNIQDINQTFINLATRNFIMITKNKKLATLLSFFAIMFSLSAFSQDNPNLEILKNSKIDSILIKKKAYNSTHPLKGYRIQLYYGNENLAYKFKTTFKKLFPFQEVTVEFDNPDWKTMVGNFRTRIAADSVNVAIKKQFLGAVVVNVPLKIE
jgi:hypothetical protein